MKSSVVLENNDLTKIDKYFCHNSYVEGHFVSYNDVVALQLFNNSNIKLDKYFHIRRWWNHMKSFDLASISKTDVQLNQVLTKLLEQNLVS